jgi:hypothetical protein
MPRSALGVGLRELRILNIDRRTQHDPHPTYLTCYCHVSLLVLSHGSKARFDHYFRRQPSALR